MDRIGIIGAGSFGTALADIIGSAGHKPIMWCRNPDQAEEIHSRHTNHKYLPDVLLSSNIEATGDLRHVAERSGLMFIAIPSGSFRAVCRELGDWVQGNQIVISTTKGIEKDTFSLMSQIIKEETCCLKIGVLSGPNLAKEIARRKPAGTVIASRFQEVIEKTTAALSSPYFRVFRSTDVYGIELGGALKNIYAIATGLVEALELGDNTKGLLFTRALAEMSRLATRLGADPITFLGLAGVGDLLTTCSSPLSRNFRVGYQLGKGSTLREAVESLGEVAEGVNTVEQVYRKAREMGITMHVLEGLYKLMFQGETPQRVLDHLMSLDQLDDVEFSTSARN